jgi:hypothetical protein
VELLQLLDKADYFAKNNIPQAPLALLPAAEVAPSRSGGARDDDSSN